MEQHTVSFRRAQRVDLATIVDIYNQAVTRHIATDDGQPVTVADKESWFDDFNDHFPLWVIISEEKIVGWVGLEEFFPHPNFAHSAQISIYFDYRYHRQSLGTQTLAFIDRQIPQLPIRTIVSYIYERNIPSQRLFTQAGYRFVGDLTNIARINGEYRTVKTYIKNYDYPYPQSLN